jgi:hypothetical protein
MTEDQIKALAEQQRQARLTEQYLRIISACEDLEVALRSPGIRNGVFNKYTDSFLESYVDAMEKEWPEICGKFKTLMRKLADLINAAKAERAKLPWYKRIFS